MKKFSFKLFVNLMLVFMALVPFAHAQIEIVYLDAAGPGSYDREFADFISNNSSVAVNFNFTNQPTVTTATLEAADLIIIGRSHSSFAFNNDASRLKFNTVTTPIICFSPFITRPSRLNWIDTENIDFEVQFTTADVVSTTSVYLNGIGDGSTLQVFSAGPYTPPLYRSGAEITSHRMSIPNSAMSTTNGDVLLRNAGNANQPVLVSWDQGVEYYAGAGQFAGGPRFLFCALDDRNYSDIGDTTIANYQLDSLTPDCASLLKVILNSLISGLPVELGSFELE